MRIVNMDRAMCEFIKPLSPRNLREEAPFLEKSCVCPDLSMPFDKVNL